MPDPNHIILHDHKLAFLLPAKTGQTSIKAALMQALGIEWGGDAPMLVHRPEHFTYLHQREIARYPYLKFCVVRNPWDRLASCWRDKYQDSRTWREFVLMVCKIEDAKADIHWRSQWYDLSCEGVFVPDRRLRFERLDQEWAFVCSAVKTLDLPPLPRLQVSTGPSTQELFDSQELVDRVRVRYQDDVEQFGYTFDPQPPQEDEMAARKNKSESKSKSNGSSDATAPRATTELTPIQYESIVQIAAKLAREEGYDPGPAAVRRACGAHTMPELTEADIKVALADARKRSKSLNHKEIVAQSTFRPEPAAG